MELDTTTGVILEEAIEVHRELGPGLLESVYEAVLAYHLTARGLRVRRQQPVRMTYAGIVLPDAFRVDLLVEDRVVLELKAVPRHDPVSERQLLTYLRLMGLPVGLLLNFGCPTLMAGVKRVVNNAPTAFGSRLRVNSTPRSPERA